ncbi:heme biosynthesis HemY N-terminal domain-containing protein [Luteimonas aquatica]|uniref:heme biosynthesis HemY N-terminal domain-containing protein n=1 Tax=Luteimonas aquatica TaxID=450364 RepID=UPI001F5A3C3A|nr:heme biosynthesis HemY N-terminal domain-containing protein [Luteimonas aquatica]
MNLFRNLLFWIVLALVGALIAQLLLQDPGYVLLRYRGTEYSMTAVSALLVLFGGLFVLWLAWTLLALPFRAWRGRRDRQHRARLGEGLDALRLGHYTRAEKLLAQASQDGAAAGAARGLAAEAAFARGDTVAAKAHLDALEDRHAAVRAIGNAELALAEHRPTDALVALDAPAAQPLPPRGLALRAQALAAAGQAAQAYGLLGPMRQQQALSEAQLSEFETRWAEAALREAGDANVLADRWEQLPKALKAEAGVVIAYAERAAALRWDDAAAKAIEQALESRWDERLAASYGTLPIQRLEQRRGNAERWLQAHPSSPALLLTLARLARAQGQWNQAEDYLHRALAQGAGSEAWEEFGHGYANAGDDARARQSYANALRAARGEAVQELGGRDLRQKIYDQAVIEERDQHGLPRLRE